MLSFRDSGRVWVEWEGTTSVIAGIGWPLLARGFGSSCPATWHQGRTRKKNGEDVLSYQGSLDVSSDLEGSHFPSHFYAGLSEVMDCELLQFNMKQQMCIYTHQICLR